MYLDKVQEELSRVVGSREVQVDDRKNMPYIDAVIHETQRFANIVPMAVPHKTSQDITFQGYFIKKVEFSVSELFQHLHTKNILENCEPTF